MICLFGFIIKSKRWLLSLPSPTRPVLLPPIGYDDYHLRLTYASPTSDYPLLRLRYPSANPLQPFITFSKTPLQTSPRRAFFNLPGCTIMCPAICISRDPPATVLVDSDVRGQLITLRPGSNSRVMNENVYEDRWKYPYPAGGPRAQLG